MTGTIKPLIGRKLQEKYNLARVIGQGATGTVYEATVSSSGERVAIKWMHGRPFREDDPELLRFMQEARIAGSLRSPHVARILEFARDEASGVPFLVMEYLQGEDVHSLLRRVGALTPEAAVQICAEACFGVAAAHAAGVLHRDIKPENLFLAESDEGALRVKVLDFGIAKIRRSVEHTGASGGITAPQYSMTESGQIVGTPLFIAPEQLDGAKHVDARSDVYALGVTLYAMLTGAPPFFEVKSLVRLLYLLVNEAPPPLRQVAPWVPAAVGAVVEKAMAKRKEERFRTVLEMASALQSWMKPGASLRPSALAKNG